ncbi:hypothetical protein HPB48_018056 [Haemaphysalis longicornis]|uniref:ABC transporter domain-containing protein n=1 Tax=Haemaphysalis longicornis TaxID=44386 RepID=A0A9J6FQ53_HAELO|nr:hypothetical protein HPB48_018056 [Haemaphysalis longicornis]
MVCSAVARASFSDGYIMSVMTVDCGTLGLNAQLLLTPVAGLMSMPLVLYMLSARVGFWPGLGCGSLLLLALGGFWIVVPAYHSMQLIIVMYGTLALVDPTRILSAAESFSSVYLLSIIETFCVAINLLMRALNKGNIGYVPQVATVFNATLRDNILFGKEYDPELYRRVLDACDLFKDIATLPAGDLTEMGDRGHNLSGGQKQRISLARAAYHECSIYVLDDPLSALDPTVGSRVYRRLIGSNGLLKNKVGNKTPTFLF